MESQILTLNLARAWLSARSKDAHKGDFGHVLVVGGQAAGFEGASLLAGEAALRAGAGWVSVASRQVGPMASRPELMMHQVSTKAELEPIMARASVIVLGPGLGQDPKAQALWESALQTKKPIVLDADGLNLLAAHPIKAQNWILTPHPGEAARLLNTSVAAIQDDRLAAAKALVDKFGGVVVLKGAGTIIIDAAKSPMVCPKSVPSMASGGMGDVLAGLLGGLLAQNLSFWKAAGLGVIVHAEAASQFGVERGLLASDLFPTIVKLLN
ncbi:MAG: NAD(P)H-hydrate dehydratase [Gammaproteobacteria bacterium]